MSDCCSDDASIGVHNYIDGSDSDELTAVDKLALGTEVGDDSTANTDYFLFI
jgi:hypothetical protein